MDELEQLKAELAEARETNRRLNRRCQELEHEISTIHRHHLALSNEMQGHCMRVRLYANELRALYRVGKRSIHNEYAEQWKRLPKPADSHIDGIRVRVDEALRLIALAEAKPKTLLTESMLRLIKNTAARISGNKP